MVESLERVEYCPVCGSGRQTEVLEEPDSLAPTGVLRLVACRDCRLVFLNPRLTLDAIVRLEDESDVYYMDLAETEREIEARVDLLRGIAPRGADGGRLLDVGCNRGLLLSAAQRLGWNPVGVELSPVAAARAREATGVPVYADLEHVPRRGGFDLVVAWHVLEHTTDPISFLKKVKGLLARDGVLALQVPSFEFVDEFRRQGRLGSLVCAVHNLQFTEQTLADTIRRAGYEPRRVFSSDRELMLTALAEHPPSAGAGLTVAGRTTATRSRSFEQHPHARFWWHKLPTSRYVPPVYGQLEDGEWKLLEEWFETTSELGAMGEINVPAMSVIQGIVMGNGLSRIVQLGHFYGYSALLLGFMLRTMGARPGVFSVDLSAEATEFTQRWVDRARLREFVHLHVGDSADEASVEEASAVLGAPPQLILVDSSHQYEHTLRELDLWAPLLPIGSFLVLHDSSRLAAAYDASGEGGVRRALPEWLARHPEMACLNINGYFGPDGDGTDLTYRDPSGLAILQREG